MSILIAHHLQEMWDANSEAKFSTNTETLANNIINFIEHHRNDVSKLIVTMHEPDNYASYDEVDQYGELPPLPEDSHRHLIEYCESNGIELEFKEYGYNWVRDPDCHDILKKEMIDYDLDSKLSEDELQAIVDQSKLDGDDIASGLPDSVLEKLDEDDLDVIRSYSPENEAYPMDELDESWIFATREGYDEENVLPIHDWQRDLVGEDVILCGAYEGECILDMETVLEHLDIGHERVDELIVGTGCEYEYVGVNPQVIIDKMECIGSELGDLLCNSFDDSSYDDTIEYFESDDFLDDVDGTRIHELMSEFHGLVSESGGVELDEVIQDSVYVSNCDVHEILVEISYGRTPEFLQFETETDEPVNDFEASLHAAVALESSKVMSESARQDRPSPIGLKL
ncbi:hypothetical protein VCHA53O466_140178 [Vibrio chagasii]|nr:hypothetical protein VCHA53O466_140178 [Vibrio chagasii]